MRRIQNRKTFEEGDNVIVKGVDRKGTVNKRKGDFYDVTLDATQEQEKNNVFAGDMVKASKTIGELAEKYQDTIYDLEDFFGVNSENGNFYLGRRLTDSDYMEGLDDICRRHNIRFEPLDTDEFTYHIIKNSRQITSMAIKQIEKYYKQGILNKREVIAILMKENGWSFPEAKQIADYYERIFNNRQIQSRFNQNAEHLYTLSEAAQYLSALFFDLRTIHFLTTGSEFYTYHELAQELYEKTEDYYDDMVETAIGYDSDVSPMYVLPGDWQFVDEHGSFDTNGQVTQTLILDRLERIYDILESVNQYDSMVQSKIDSMLEYYDKEIYKLKQAMK